MATEPVGPATYTPAPTTSQPNYSDSELRHFAEADLKAASRGSWTMADQLDPHTFRRLEQIRDTKPGD